MKKFDLHIHTIKTDSDSAFSFSLEKLKEYVAVSNIDVIAITNHNIFDNAQYQDIVSALPGCLVLPGIEVNYAGGHMLVIADSSDIDDFENKATIVKSEIVDIHDSITPQRFKEIFTDLSKYLLIPHYDKKPKVSSEAISALGSEVFVGEVSSPKKFVQATKDEKSLVPVLFSDCRLTDSIDSFAFNQTYIDIDVVSLRTLKSVLHDRMKVALSSEGRDFIDINNGEVLISKGLNIILGKRSSGKTHTLKTIERQFGTHNIKYIHQFELLHKDEEKDRIEFDSLLAEKRSSLFDDYIEEFKLAFDDYLKVPARADDNDRVQAYVESLVTYAQEEDLKDAYSSSKLYTETPYNIVHDAGLERLVKNLKEILDNSQYKPIIDKYIPREKLVELYLVLLKNYSDSEAELKKKEWINDLVGDIKHQLQFHSSSTNIEEVDFSDIIRNKIKRKKFLQLAHLVKREKTIKNYQMQKFNIVAKTKQFDNATDMSNVLHIKTKFSSAYDNYAYPLDFVESLCEVVNISKADLFRFFIKLDYEVLNEHNLPVSGGERSEFNLLQMIQDAKKYDMLLIDEPESSFDNIFLKNEVNKMIKDISAEMPVVIVTHNSTIGASISPDYIIYTKREIINNNPVFKIFYGHPKNPYLVNKDNETEKNYLIQINSLEAGKEAYDERMKNYADLEN